MKTYKEYGITDNKIFVAESVLVRNGIDADEAKAIIQELGYVLLDCEMYPAPIYPEDDKDITKWNEILSAKEVGECQEFGASIGWGFNRITLSEQITRFDKGDAKEKCKVYFILEDCNFHDVAGMLAKGKVKEAYEWANTQID